MKTICYTRILIFSTIVWLGMSGFSPARAQTTTSQGAVPPIDAQSAAELLKRLDQLAEQNERLERQNKDVEQQNKELMEQINVMRRTLGGQAPLKAAPAPSAPQAAKPTEPAEEEEETSPVMDASQEGEAPTAAEQLATVKGPNGYGEYTPNFGFKVVDTPYGDMRISVFSYARYLNQLDLAPTYTNAFGVTSAVQQRQDFQLNKVQIKFLGWILSPKFRYFVYAWTANTNMGLGAQVVVAGNLNYEFDKHFILSAGVNGLPGTRSLEGNFPYWLSLDSRLITDEFFRPSYTSGVWARGQLIDKMRYSVMAGDNLSQIGVNAGQLPSNLSTWAGSLVWMPTTGEFGPGFGDFEEHEKLATRLGAHFTRSRADKQAQPGTEDFQNTQIRLADGSIVFTPNLFGPGFTVQNVTYKMTSFDGGLKLHGYSLEGEYFMRWLTNFRGAPVPNIFNQGFQLQLSAMVIPKTFQIYSGGSTIFGGQYGTPYDARIGTNFFPWHNRVIRWNNEGLYLYKSPVGYYSVPFTVGGKGWVFMSNLELAF